ncbi:AAA domain-containing protein [Lactococcus garvieae]|uniref:AAA domain-containing protein n=1 Tax=Lactococcus garvieae TaxID=1363 RepID=UPI00398E4230
MMNQKNNILDAWILIEQLSEGDIKLKDKRLRTISEGERSFQQLFAKVIEKEGANLSERALKKSGIVFYFDIFDFKEIIDIIRDMFHISSPTSYEEIKQSNKFTFALYFDYQLNFQADKFFRSISGYIRYKKEIPEDFYKIEIAARDRISEQFENGSFDKTISWLLKVYNVHLGKCRYSFIKNLESDAINLHSFFINDLRKAKNVSSENLERYFEGFSGNRQNLDSQNTSIGFSERIFEEILQPKFYPLGRFPTNPKHKLSFMQQVAVNLALHDSNDIRSVNGPPGTGKTTLLKDIFADLVVQQAYEISKLKNKNLKGSIMAYKESTLAILPREISNKNIVVASSNNSAVQNIVKELPRLKDIDRQFQYVSYFKDLYELPKDDKLSKDNEKYWGLFSLEGGKSSNVNKLLAQIKKIKGYLSTEYESDSNVYSKFIQKYNDLKAEISDIQKYADSLKELKKARAVFKDKLEKFESENEQNSAEIFHQKEIVENELQLNLEEQAQLSFENSNIIHELDSLNLNNSQYQKEYNLLLSRRPTFFNIRKLFNSTIVKNYQNELSESIVKSGDLTNKLLEVQTLKMELDKKVGILADNYKRKSNFLTKKVKDYEKWLDSSKKELSTAKSKIEILKKEIENCQIESINPKLSYEEFQKSNPWFSDDLRIKQSELFILALKVREQFLYENSKHLNSAILAWNMQEENIAKEHGQMLLREAWQWINFSIPVISTTFASFGKMFRFLEKDSISNLFIDEAGQALPQASVGAILKSRKIMVVGDPSQIKPVLNLDSTMLALIARHHKVDENFVSLDASTQSLIDRTSQYGYQTNESEWIGIPLWVHRRCKDPMFSISNEISYNNLMVQGNDENNIGKAKWIDCSGNANDKFVREQSKWLELEIKRRLEESPELIDKIYIITPFSNVAYNLAKDLDKIGFTKRDNETHKPTNVGTVHTFQGKEAKIVYFVLGADESSKGAARWVFSNPNLMNVAATRAKEEFYIIGDKKLYENLKNDIINTTIDNIDKVNKNSFQY